jgi:hypothetical protein
MPTASIIGAIEAVRTSETSVNFYETTRRHSPENSHLHIRLTSHLLSNLPKECGGSYSCSCSLFNAAVQ